MSIADKLQTIAENEQKVYDAGYAKGRAEGGGGNDEFWDVFQTNGNRVAYGYAFGGEGWTDAIFKPKYDMQPSDCTRMFAYSRITDITTALENAGVTLDTSQSGAFVQFLYLSTAERVPPIDIGYPGSGWNQFALSATRLKEIHIRNIREDHLFSQTFQDCRSLETITFTGTIGQTASFQWCPLSVDSMKNIISCLKNLVGTDAEGTRSIKFTEDCWTALNADSIPDGYASWRDYVEHGLGWVT